MPFILFDVGANSGTDSLYQTESNSHYQTYAFEPTPELFNILVSKSNTFKDRYHVHQIALSNFDGKATFNVAAHHDWGTSSLLEFNDGLDKTWKNRRDFYVDRKIDVNVLTFSTWFETVKPDFDKIDFFHCDTQGCDLKVLQGMGDYIQMIVEGVVECPQSKDVMLYKGQHSKEDMQDFLNDHGFYIFKTESQQNEDNLFFRKL